jgi:hypothetical protein
LSCAAKARFRGLERVHKKAARLAGVRGHLAYREDPAELTSAHQNVYIMVHEDHPDPGRGREH